MLRSVTSRILSPNNFLSQFVRTTFVLRRNEPIPLKRKNERPKKLRGRDFKYELVEYTSVKKQPDLEVVLKQFVEGVGRKGQIVKLKPNKAYEELLLPGLAAYATPENIEKYKAKEGEIVVEEQPSSQYALSTVRLLRRMTFNLLMNKDQPWVVEPWHIRATLRRCGINVLSDSCIELPKEKITGPDMMKENKVFKATLTINNKEKVDVRFKLHHWSTDPRERLPYIFEHWKFKAEPLIPVVKKQAQDVKKVE